MLYRTLKRMIQRGQIDGMGEKLALLYATDALTREEYEELSAMLPNDEQ